MRDGDVGAGEPGSQQPAHRGRELAWPDRQRDVGAIDPVALQPEPMQAGRAGIRDRPTGDTGDSGVTGQDRHAGTIPARARKINAGFIQTPRSDRHRAGLPCRRSAVQIAAVPATRLPSMPRDETSQPERDRPRPARRCGWSASAGAGAATAALDGVSIDVAPGSFTVLLGPSGCGKTTCLRIVAGLETATEGRVEIAGRDVTDLPPAARGVAMVFQSYALFPHLTVAENIVFGLKARRVPAAERARRLARAVEILGIGHLLRAQAGPAVRRPAAARGAGPRHRRRGAGLPDGRAAVEPRRAASRRHAARDPGAAAAARHHHAVRHARPDRGHGHGRPDRAAARRPYRAGRAAGRDLRATRQPVSPPASSARRR